MYKIVKSKFLVLPLFILLFSCVKKEAQTEAMYEIKLEKEMPEAQVSDFIESMDSIHLETSENSLLGTIGKIQFLDQRIYILDNYFAKALFIFDRQGHFIHKMQKVGDGPEEYLSLNDFTIDEKNKQIILLADGGRKVIFTDYDLNYLGEKKLDMSYFSFIFNLDNGYGLGNHVSAGDEHLLYIVGKDFEVKDKYLPIPEEYYKIIINGFVKYTGVEENYLVAPTFSTAIYNINKNGFSKKYEFILQPKDHLSENKIKEYKNLDPMEMVEKIIDFFDFFDYFDLKDHLFCTFSLNKNKYWCLYNRNTREVKYVNHKNVKSNSPVSPDNIHFIYQADENTMVGFLIDPEREEKELNPMLLLCKVRADG